MFALIKTNSTTRFNEVCDFPMPVRFFQSTTKHGMVSIVFECCLFRMLATIESVTLVGPNRVVRHTVRIQSNNAIWKEL